MNDKIIAGIIAQFLPDCAFVSSERIPTGHINFTFKVNVVHNDNEVAYLLQKINPDVFKRPIELMENISGVTAFLRNKIVADGGDPERETLSVIPTADGRNCYMDESNAAWRLYNFIENSYSPSAIESKELFYDAGVAFGTFQNMLADYPADSLHETIPDFHNTAKRFENLVIAVKEDAAGRAQSVQEEIKFAFDRKNDTSVLVDMIAAGELPIRVTHNDTKLNNILFDCDTNKPLCITDLDTVMPGLSLYDFGDSIRFGANTAAEDEQDYTKVALDIELYEAYARGYLSAAGNSLTQREVSLLPLSAKMMTFECGMRFLTDYLNGDIYFGIKYPMHNLVRCHTQFALVYDIEQKYEQMLAVTKKAYEEICGRTF